MARTSKPRKLENGRWNIRWLDENGIRQSQCYSSYKEADTSLTQKKFEVSQIKMDCPIAFMVKRLSMNFVITG